MLIARFLTLFIALLCLVGCQSLSVETRAPGIAPILPAARLEPTAAALNAFSYKLYANVVKTDAGGNLAVSPIGSYILLALLREGAGGATKQEISAALGRQSPTLDDIARLVTELEAGEELTLAQKIYVSKQVALRRQFLEKAGRLLDDTVTAVPFKEDPPAAAAIINDWVAEKTAGRITDLLSVLPEQTVSVLVSALYFKAQWVNPFERTVPTDFHAAADTVFKVPMISGVAEERLAFRLPNAQGVALPYRGTTEMVLLLPDPGESPDAVLAGLDLTGLPLQRRGEPIENRVNPYEGGATSF